MMQNGKYSAICLQCIMTTLLAVSISHFVRAQVNEVTIKPLRVGDSLPAGVMTVLRRQLPANSHPGAAQPSLFLIDFWATWCGSCITAFPKLQQLQQELGDSLAVLLVTDEPASLVEQFKERRRKAGLPSITLPGITADTLLNRLFPHSYIPHTVWIDEYGQVKAITETGEVTAANLRAMMAGGRASVLSKDDAARDATYDVEKPFFLNGNGGNGAGVIWYSVLSRQVADIQGALALMRNDSRGGFIQLTNAGINTMVRFAYADNPAEFEDLLPAQRIQFVVRDSSRWFPRFSGTRLLSGQLYNYSLVTPPLADSLVKKCMQEDLHRFAAVKASWKTKLVDCLVLTAADTGILHHAYADTGAVAVHATSPYHYNSLNNPLKYFIQYLNKSCQWPLLIIDETHYSGLALFSIEANMNDWQAVNKALAPFKMRLKKKQRLVKILTVKEE